MSSDTDKIQRVLEDAEQLVSQEEVEAALDRMAAAIEPLIREQNPLLRGRELAREAGCPTCHVPYRGQEIPNPGSRWQVVPRFEAGNAMMYADSSLEVVSAIAPLRSLAHRATPPKVIPVRCAMSRSKVVRSSVQNWSR